MLSGPLQQSNSRRDNQNGYGRVNFFLMLIFLSISTINQENLYLISLLVSVIDLHKSKLQGKTLPLPPNGAYLDFLSNNFSSVLQNDIGKHLVFTIFFSLSNNHLHGPVPESICEASYLKVLDLSNNHLMGTIPQCLMLKTLKVLNLRNNNFSRRILKVMMLSLFY